MNDTSRTRNRVITILNEFDRVGGIDPYIALSDLSQVLDVSDDQVNHYVAEIVDKTLDRIKKDRNRAQEEIKRQGKTIAETQRKAEYYRSKSDDLIVKLGTALAEESGLSEDLNRARKRISSLQYKYDEAFKQLSDAMELIRDLRRHLDRALDIGQDTVRICEEYDQMNQIKWLR